VYLTTLLKFRTINNIIISAICTINFVDLSNKNYFFEILDEREKTNCIGEGKEQKKMMM